MEGIVKSSTDYNFINRFMTAEDIRELKLNKVSLQYGIKWGNDDIEDMDDENVYVKTDVVKDWMLNFFTSYNRPRIYIIDTDFSNGGLLLFHRDDGKKLKEDWMFPTCSNIAAVWKGHVHIISNGVLYSYTGASKSSQKTTTLDRNHTFEQIVETMKEGNKVKIS